MPHVRHWARTLFGLPAFPANVGYGGIKRKRPGHHQTDAIDPKLTFTMPSLPNIQFGTTKAFAAAEPLTPDALGDPHFDPKQVRAGARCAGCQ